jgi:hypothetical protein
MNEDGLVKVFGGEHPDLESIPVPVGELCFHCEEVIAEGERGFSSMYMGERGSRRIYFHRDCFLRGISGSVAHIQHKCSCYVPGASEGDPPGMTKREAARAAVAEWEFWQKLEKAVFRRAQ